jgi:hypothetical protein
VRVSVRTSERKAIIQLLETDYPSVEALADDVLKVILSELAGREAIGLSIPVGPTLHLAVGPFWHSTEAKAVAKKLPGTTVHTLAPPRTLMLALEDPGDKTTCPECNHPTFAHFTQKASCVVPKCKCKESYAWS